MMNTIGVPVALIGTNTARTLIEADLAASRRFIGNIPAFVPFVKGAMWMQFLKELWRYQYLRVYTPMDGFEDLFLQLTGGIPDLVVKLYLLVQLRLFGKKSEVINETVIRQTADLLLFPVKNRVAEIKGLVPATPGLTTALASADKDFKQHANEECNRVGSSGIFSDVQSAPPVEITTESKTSERSESSLIGAVTVTEAKNRLAQKGQLGLNR